jgi:hypothetical protein
MNSSSSASSRTSNGSDNGISNEKPIFTKQKEWVNTGTPDGEIKVFHPTMEEFANFPKYIEKLEREQAHLSSGVCKVSSCIVEINHDLEKNTFNKPLF